MTRGYKRYCFWSLLLVLLLTVVSCHKNKEPLTYLSGTIVDNPEEEDTKVYLSDRERWLRWEKGDQIYVWSNSGEKGLYNLMDASHKHLTGTFESAGNSGIVANSALYAFYPPTLATNGSGFVGEGSMYLFFPREHPYRDNTSDPDPATDPDSSFGKGVMPMVAFRDASDDHELSFHALAGVLRLQLYGGSGLTEEFTINTITLEEKTQRLSGNFNITKSDIEDNQPHVTATAVVTDDDRKISITGINKIIGGNGVNKDNLFTFYLPLPAVANPYGSDPHHTEYKLKMHVIGTQGDNTKYFVRTLTVDIRRLSLTLMPAMEINTLSDVQAGTGSEGTPRIVGSGTVDRPFQIYTAEQLAYLRDRMNNNQTVNGQVITESTHVKIVRSDIMLVPPRSGSKASGIKEDTVGKTVVWTEGFRNFKCRMYFSSSAGENGGIMNISDVPLFESISNSGNVEGVYVKGDKTFTSGSGTFSSMCDVNNGTMTDCHNRCNVTSTSGHNLAGLCCVNNGTITGGANDALLQSTGGNVAGICYVNNGSLQGNFSLSSSVPQGTNIAGICFTNSSAGVVENCQVAANIPTVNSNGNWGVVVFENSGRVTNCRSVGTIVFSTSGSIGGVVHTNNTDGIVDGCSLNVTLRGGSGSVGGIVSVMNGGVVRNCYANGDCIISGIPSGGYPNHAEYAGGIVGWLHNGAVYNCYNRCSVTGAVNSGTVLGRIDLGANIENCWSDNNHGFLGDVSLSRPDQGEIGPFCFSGYAVDTNLNCVLILQKWFRIMVPWNLKHKVDLAGNNLDATMQKFKLLTDNFYVSAYYGNNGVGAYPPDVNPGSRPENDKYLCDALNIWVTTYGSGTYRSWTSTENANYDIYPIYTNSKNAAKRYPPVTARHSYKRR